MHWIKKSTVLSEPGMLCEMFAALGLEVDGTSEERAISLSDVIPEDFETLVHFYNDFRLVILQQSLQLSELTRRTGHKGFLPGLPHFNTGTG